MQHVTPNPGLCSHCANARVIENPRGSTFILCTLSESDPRFPKYPRLPVLSCDGFEESDPAQQRCTSSS
ncbi:MAG: hypothetical protein L0Y80_01160 [Ignavibacteriae bacterium]|nr:hypothetical protein [Ignavibacteriota bacterium]